MSRTKFSEISAIGFAVCSLFLAVTSAVAQNSVPETSTLRVAHFSVETVPEGFRDYVFCRFEEPEAQSLGSLEVFSLSAESDADCEDELDTARVEILSFIRQQDHGASPEAMEAYTRFFLNNIDSFSLPATVRFEPLNSGEAIYTVPDGMWEYHVCAMDRAGSRVQIDGDWVEPKFPDDPECNLAREYSRTKAIEFLRTQDPSISETRATQRVERYIADIDERAESTPQ